jgi:hypothetical protein
MRTSQSYSSVSPPLSVTRPGSVAPSPLGSMDCIKVMIIVMLIVMIIVIIIVK